MHANFLLGTLHVTEAAKLKLRRIPTDLIARHAVNDHGNVTVREMRRNQIGLKTLGEITSRFAINPLDTAQGNVLVITEAHWADTIVKLEEEQ
jgi:hypothetical protein